MLPACEGLGRPAMSLKSIRPRRPKQCGPGAEQGFDRVLDMENPAHKEPGGICEDYNARTAGPLPLVARKLPAVRTAVLASGVGELAVLQVGHRQPGPPMPAGACRRGTTQVAGQVVT